MKEFEENISYYFSDTELLNTALTHSSYANEHDLEPYMNNERLEFLGDAVLNVVVSKYLYNRFKTSPEGDLTKKRATVVCESSLAFAARKINLGKYILLGKGEAGTGGRDRDSILADTFEAIVGAIYLDEDIDRVEKLILEIFEEEAIAAFYEGSLFTDYKTELQERLQKKVNGNIEYLVEREEGPDHDKRFYMDVWVKNKVIGSGVGRNKKEAEQMAAKEALRRMGVINEK